MFDGIFIREVLPVQIIRIKASKYGLSVTNKDEKRLGVLKIFGKLGQPYLKKESQVVICVQRDTGHFFVVLDNKKLSNRAALNSDIGRIATEIIFSRTKDRNCKCLPHGLIDDLKTIVINNGVVDYERWTHWQNGRLVQKPIPYGCALFNRGDLMLPEYVDAWFKNNETVNRVVALLCPIEPSKYKRNTIF